ncbi:flagellar alpha dynein [Microcoleus sp. AR_TQ3_B6]|uniref:flagellar alpha dynein n=1 Tax=Microcoleus sp. AR_TQ3_B6 TaxID=3055284 RepID=UPI002FD5A1C3
MKAANKQLAEWDAELNQLHERNGDLGLKVQMLEQELKEARRSRDESENSAPTVAEFPEPADLLNQLKARRKKSRADLADINAILGLLADGNGSNPV